MKKKIIGSFLALAFAAMIGINANIGLSNQAEEPSIAISNVEALANGEWGSTYCRQNGNYYCVVWGWDYPCYCSMNY